MMHGNCYSMMKTMGLFYKHRESKKDDENMMHASKVIALNSRRQRIHGGHFLAMAPGSPPPRDLGTPIGVLLPGRIGY